MSEGIERVPHGLEGHYKKCLINPVESLQDVFKETEELIAIVPKSIETASSNSGKK